MANGTPDQRLDIATTVISELDHFDGNFKVEITPTDRARYVVFESQMQLKAEPFIAFVRAEVNGEEKIYLICRNYTPFGVTPLNSNGTFVSYKAPLGSIASKRIGEEFTFYTPGGSKHVIVLQRDVFRPIKTLNWDATENKLSFADQEHLVESLRELIKQLSLQPALADTFEFSEVDFSVVLSDLDEFAEPTTRKIGRIAQIISLRDQPILDEFQDELFRLPLRSQLILTGAPGTGKTTVLIRRLAQKTKFDLLTDDEKRGLSEEQATTLFDPNHSWLMFTPNELLKGYLKEALSKELLPANEHTVKTWTITRNLIARDVLKFLKAGNSGYFSKTDDEILLPATRRGIAAYLKRFTDFYLHRSRQRATDAFKKFRELSTTASSRPSEPVFERFDSFAERLGAVAARLNYAGEEWNAERASSMFERLANFRSESEEIRSEIRSLLGQLLKQIIRDRGSMIREISAKQPNPGAADARKASLKSIQDALIWFGNEGRAINTASDRIASETWAIIDSHLLIEEKEKLRETLVPLVQCRRALLVVQRFLRGFATVIANIPAEYDQFRRGLLIAEENEFFSASQKENLDNKRISNEETDLIIFTMLRDARTLFEKNKDLLYGPTGDSLLEEIKGLYRTQISVDEATDFSAIQLGCMYQLAHPEFNSVSFVGDLMQRVTADGLRNWQECDLISDSFAIKTLGRVYRQSPKLLSIAAKLYEKSVGEKPSFASAFENDGLDPQPLVLFSDDNDRVGRWVANRIVEIYELNGFRLPSVAIFVAADSDIDDIYSHIREPLSQHSIDVEKCPEGRILGTDARVRIFSVEYIKGLEFGAVFFVNIDHIHEQVPELVDKYLYVGLTRATTFLGVTCAGSLPASIAVAASDFHEGDWQSLTVDPTVAN